MLVKPWKFIILYPKIIITMIKYPSLCKLPPPSFPKNSWPWQEEAPLFPKTMPNLQPWPRINFVTPSYNQGLYLEETIRSVLLQRYPNLEYIIIDGGSTDYSIDIIRKYEPWLSYWVSEKDSGQYNAINKGFKLGNGEIMGWINSGDVYCPWAFRVVAEVFLHNPQVEWVTTLYPLRWDENGVPFRCNKFSGYSKEAFYEGRYGGTRERHVRLQYIQQESTFWRRSLWERAGSGLDERFAFAADFDLWARFFKHTELYGVGVPLAGNRIHPNQKNTDPAYEDECIVIRSQYPQTRKKRIRSLCRKFYFHRIPLVRSWLSRYIGYELHSLIGYGDGKWEPRIIKEFV